MKFNLTHRSLTDKRINALIGSGEIRVVEVRVDRNNRVHPDHQRYSLKATLETSGTGSAVHMPCTDGRALMISGTVAAGFGLPTGSITLFVRTCGDGCCSAVAEIEDVNLGVLALKPLRETYN